MLSKKYLLDISIFQRIFFTLGIDLQICILIFTKDGIRGEGTNHVDPSRVSSRNRDLDTMSVLFFPPFLSFACWTRAYPLKVSQMISNITVKLFRRCGSPVVPFAFPVSRSLFFL